MTRRLEVMEASTASSVLAERLWEEKQLGAIRRRWLQWPHWMPPGRGRSPRRDMELLAELGFAPSAQVPDGAEVIYAPTGSVRRGPDGRLYHWVGPWARNRG